MSDINGNVSIGIQANIITSVAQLQKQLDVLSKSLKLNVSNVNLAGQELTKSTAGATENINKSTKALSDYKAVLNRIVEMHDKQLISDKTFAESARTQLKMSEADTLQRKEKLRISNMIVEAEKRSEAANISKMANIRDEAYAMNEIVKSQTKYKNNLNNIIQNYGEKKISDAEFVKSAQQQLNMEESIVLKRKERVAITKMIEQADKKVSTSATSEFNARKQLSDQDAANFDKNEKAKQQAQAETQKKLEAIRNKKGASSKLEIFDPNELNRVQANIEAKVIQMQSKFASLSKNKIFDEMFNPSQITAMNAQMKELTEGAKRVTNQGAFKKWSNDAKSFESTLKSANTYISDTGKLSQREQKESQIAEKENASVRKNAQDYENFWLKALRAREIQEVAMQERAAQQVANIARKTGKSSELHIYDPNELKQVQLNLETQVNQMQTKFSAMSKNKLFGKIFEPQQIADMNTEMQRLITNAGKINNKGAFTQWKKEARQFNDTLGNMNSQIQDTAKSTRGFASDILHNVGKFALWTISATLLMAPLRQLQEGIKFIVEMNKEFTNLQMEMTNVTLDFNEVTKVAHDYAVEMKTTTKNVMEAVAVFSTYTSTMDQVLEKTRAAIILSNITGQNVGQTADALMGTMQQFGIAADDSTHVVDVIAGTARMLQMDYPKAVAEVSTGLRTVGSVAVEAKVPIEQLSAMVGTLADKTRRTGTEVANALFFEALVA